jgi:hypothetical protein
MSGAVVAFHTASGQYLAAGGFWTARAADAIDFASADDANRFLARHACEQGAWQVIASRGASESDAAA